MTNKLGLAFEQIARLLHASDRCGKLQRPGDLARQEGDDLDRTFRSAGHRPESAGQYEIAAAELESQDRSRWRSI